MPRLWKISSDDHEVCDITPDPRTIFIWDGAEYNGIDPFPWTPDDLPDVPEVPIDGQITSYWQGAIAGLAPKCCPIIAPGFENKVFWNQCGIAPLRQRQRDDHLVRGARVRIASGNNPKSRQVSERQGHPNTYL